MSNDQIPPKLNGGTAQNSQRMKRRDLLLSGSSLVAASALSAVGLTNPARAQQPAPTPPTGQRPNILFIMGDDVGWFNIGAPITVA